MTAKLPLWGRHIKQHWVAIGVVATVLVVVIALIIAVHWFGWDTGFGGGESKMTISRTSKGITTATELQPGKTLWDWMQLLFVPAVLTLGAVWITSRQNHDREIAGKQRQTDRELAEQQHMADYKLAVDNQHEADLQAYIDKMSELLLEKKLRESKADDEVRNLARVRTSTVLPRLDPERKRSVLLFLHESGLIDTNKPIIDLLKANLKGVALDGANLTEADLHGAILWNANLDGANLSGTDLSGAELTKANVTLEQLDKAKSLKGAIMPDGSKHP